MVCRVSGDKQERYGGGLDSQEIRCLQYCDQKEYNVLKIFSGTVSGLSKILERPEIKDLFKFLKKHNKPVVVVFDDHKRFARATKQHLILRERLSSLQTRSEFLNFKLEDSPEGKFIETFLAAQSQLEREQNKRQTIQKMRTKFDTRFDSSASSYRIPNVIRGRGKSGLIEPDENFRFVQNCLLYTSPSPRDA